MRFNTITYDANLPTVQQVNVPTNTDYKIGMKVKRNGNVQSIKPSEFTITSEDGTTIPVDPEKTNGYVTITKASGDNASFKQYGVKVDVQAYNEEYRKVEQFGSTSPDPNPSYTRLYASDLRIAGMEIKASDFANACVYTWRKAAEPPATGTDGWTARPLIATSGATAVKAYYFAESTTIGDVVWGVCRADSDYTLDENTAVPELVGFTLKAGNYYFFKVELVTVYGTKFIEIHDTHIFAPEDLVVYNGGLKFTANYWWGKQFIWSFGTPFTADFKLNINEFKSQSGDIAETLADGSSVKVDGTYADGTTFSFDFCTK